jgi:hypothetical protein
MSVQSIVRRQRRIIRYLAPRVRYVVRGQVDPKAIVFSDPRPASFLATVIGSTVQRVPQ